MIGWSADRLAGGCRTLVDVGSGGLSGGDGDRCSVVVSGSLRGVAHALRSRDAFGL